MTEKAEWETKVAAKVKATCEPRLVSSYSVIEAKG